MGQEGRIKEGAVVRKERYNGVVWAGRKDTRGFSGQEGKIQGCCVGRKEGTEKRKFHLKEGKQQKI